MINEALTAMSVAMDDADLLDAHISFLETRGNATNRVRGPSRQLPSTWNEDVVCVLHRSSSCPLGARMLSTRSMNWTRASALMDTQMR